MTRELRIELGILCSRELPQRSEEAGLESNPVSGIGGLLDWKGFFAEAASYSIKLCLRVTATASVRLETPSLEKMLLT
jgi:hypothetical protein